MLNLTIFFTLTTTILLILDKSQSDSPLQDSVEMTEKKLMLHI